MKEILIGGALLVGFSVTLLELFPAQDEIIAAKKTTVTEAQTPAATLQIVSNGGLQNMPKQALPVSDELVERDPDAISSQADLFRTIVKPPPPPVAKEPIPVAVVPVPKPTFSFMGTVVQETELQAIVLNGEETSILKRGDAIAGFRVVAIDERNLTLSHQVSETKVLLAAKVVQ